MKQCSILSAGCQIYSKNILSSSNDNNYFAYASTLAIYIYRKDTYELLHLLAGHKKTITSLVFSPIGPQCATCSIDKSAYIWTFQKELISMSINLPYVPINMEWIEDAKIHFLFENGESGYWNLTNNTLTPLPTILQSCCFVRWSKKSKAFFANNEGDIILFDAIADKYTPLDWGDFFKVEARVVDCQWDPLSSSYAVFHYVGGAMFLIDVELNKVILDFESINQEISSICWVKTQPGAFLTLMSTTAVLKLWNVSQKKPLKIVRVGKKTEGGCTVKEIAPETLLMSFRDGSVVIFDSKANRVLHNFDSGHSETVFDVRFKPSNPNIFATCSYDSSIKIWDLSNSSLICSLNASGVFYSIAWQGDLIAVATSKGDVIIFNTLTMQIIKKISLHSNMVYHVTWKDQDILVSTSGDSKCLIFTETGKLIKSYDHPDAVFGCDVNPFNRNLICTGCQDGIVRVFDTSKPGYDPIFQEKCHTNKVFHTFWSPLLPDFIASGGDDQIICVWNIKTGNKYKLKGHTSNVRAISWHPEIPHLLLSGSWDSSIRVWDLRSSSCVSFNIDHHADVYGLDCHPSRPFVFVSSSRDSSLRVWNLDLKDINALRLRSLIQGNLPLDTIIDANTDKFFHHPEYLTLAGQASKKLFQEIKNAKPLEKYKRLIDFFMFLPGVHDFFNLLGAGIPKYSSNNTIHTSKIASVYHSYSQSLQKPMLGLSAGKKEDRFLEAADIAFMSGNFTEFCEIHVKLGNWEKALSVAPAVSYEYWSNLSFRYAAHLQAEKDEASALYYSACGDISKASDFYLCSNDYKSAFLMSRVVTSAPSPLLFNSSSISNVTTNTPLTSSLLLTLCEYELSMGRPLLSANYYLSVNDNYRAYSYLMRGNEPELAYVLAQIFNMNSEDLLLAMLRRCELLNLWKDGLQLLTIANANDDIKLLFFARHNNQFESRKDFYKTVGLHPPEHYISLSESAASSPIRIINLVAAGDSTNAVRLCCSNVNELISKSSWNITDALKNMRPIFSSSLDGIDINLRDQFLSYTLYIGALDAMNKGSDYGTIVVALFEKLFILLERNPNFKFPVPSYLLRFQLYSFMLMIQFTSNHAENFRTILNLNPPASFKSIIESRLKLISSSTLTSISSSNTKIIPSCNNLPSGSHKLYPYISSLTRLPINGMRYIFEDDTTVCSYSEILMWSSVCPFSPLLDGSRVVLN